MKIKKEYTYDNNRQIWRLIPAEPDKIIIEERDTDTKEVFFNCINIETGKKIFHNHQFNEKFWIGIETINKDIIYFNKYLKPDMPQHKGIIAFDIGKQKILWENPDLVFLFIKDEKLFSYIQKFEGRSFFILNSFTGELVEEIGGDPVKINELRENIVNPVLVTGQYLFPQRFYEPLSGNVVVDTILNNFKADYIISGHIEYIHYENLVLMNTFEPNDNGTLNNIFRTIDIDSGKVIFAEVLSDNSRAAVPDSFFMKNNFIFLLKARTKLIVYSVKK